MDGHSPPRDTIQQAKAIFRKAGGMLRMADAVRAGIHRDTLRTLVEQGVAQKITRGLYCLTDAPPSTHVDLAIVATKIPQGIICLLSALAFHELTTQIPHEVHVAIPRNQKPPRLGFPPIQTFRFSGHAFTAGIEQHEADSTLIRVYCPEKTLADCFKFRNRIGLDTCIEALRYYREKKKFHPDSLLHFAKICRVQQVMRPYIESVL